MKIAFILGTRPEIIKLAPIIKECENSNIEFSIIHTNQHYDASMDEVFFSELELQPANYNLHIGSGTQGAQIGSMLAGIETTLQQDKPDVVLVQGDTNTVLAGALIASRLGITVGHVEAGLRSYDRTMPEEVNRILTDTLANFLFCPTDVQKEILLNEGISKEKIVVTGNTIVDAVCAFRDLAARRSTILKDKKLKPNEYFLLTCHRPSNTDDDKNFSTILEGIELVSKKAGYPCLFPVHPRLAAKYATIKKYSSIIPTDPMGYLDLLNAQQHSLMIFTDSGGIQEEACILEKKSVILRLNTERPEAVAVGGAQLLTKIDSNEIEKTFNELQDRKVDWYNPFGDGTASRQILDHIYNA